MRGESQELLLGRRQSSERVCLDGDALTPRQLAEIRSLVRSSLAEEQLRSNHHKIHTQPAWARLFEEYVNYLTLSNTTNASESERALVREEVSESVMQSLKSDSPLPCEQTWRESVLFTDRLEAMGREVLKELTLERLIANTDLLRAFAREDWDPPVSRRVEELILIDINSQLNQVLIQLNLSSPNSARWVRYSQENTLHVSCEEISLQDRASDTITLTTVCGFHGEWRSVSVSADPKLWLSEETSRCSDCLARASRNWQLNPTIPWFACSHDHKQALDEAVINHLIDWKDAVASKGQLEISYHDRWSLGTSDHLISALASEISSRGEKADPERVRSILGANTDIGVRA